MIYSVLLVDDEIFFCSSLEVLLKANGYSVTIAHTGQAALDCLKNSPFAAALVDIGLPDISGSTLIAHIVKHHTHTAAIVLTGNATLDNAVDALRHGVYDYLQKPCSPERLLRTVAQGIQHKKLEKELRDSENRFRQLADATWEGIILYDEGRLLQTNNQLSHMFGYKQEELLGQQIFDILLERESIKTLYLMTNPDTIGPFEANGIHKDGTSFPVEIRVKHIDYQGRQVQVAAIRDVTASRTAHQQRLDLQVKLADAQRMESLGLMAGSVAHDLNNIMAGIITYPELLLLDLGPDFKYREEIIMIRDAGKRAAAVVSDLLTVARGATSKKELQNLNTITTSYLKSAECRELRNRYKGVSINSYLEDKLHPLSCSAMHICKSIMNLVNNAVEAIQEKGLVTISTKNTRVHEPVNGYEYIEAGEYVTISVEDNGPGISSEDIKQIFSPFYSKKIMGRSGTGLGLAVVWNTVHDHGGYVDLQSTPEGTIFTLYFPIDPNGNPVIQPPPTLEACHGNGEKILVVDDQQSQRDIAKKLLARLGYQVFTVKSGEEAVDFVKQQQVDLILLDMIMDPGLNGCETYELILKQNPNLKAIITSGYSTKENIAQAKDLGISQFVKKPYSLQEIGQALKLEISQ